MQSRQRTTELVHYARGSWTRLASSCSLPALSLTIAVRRQRSSSSAGNSLLTAVICERPAHSRWDMHETADVLRRLAALEREVARLRTFVVDERPSTSDTALPPHEQAGTEPSASRRDLLRYGLRSLCSEPNDSRIPRESSIARCGRRVLLACRGKARGYCGRSPRAC
jgi:hypothetical protein